MVWMLGFERQPNIWECPGWLRFGDGCVCPSGSIFIIVVDVEPCSRSTSVCHFGCISVGEQLGQDELGKSLDNLFDQPDSDKQSFAGIVFSVPWCCRTVCVLVLRQFREHWLTQPWICSAASNVAAIEMLSVRSYARSGYEESVSMPAASAASLES